MKKVIRLGIAMMLAVLMAVLSPIQIIAASKPVYISDIRLSGNKERLEEMGYTVLDKDLNSGKNEGSSYIGYKTTDDPNEAITDMSVMDMKGGYSFGDYETILEYQKREIKKQVEIYKVAIEEFRVRFAEGSPSALLAKDTLNNYIEDDSGKLLGDMLIDASLKDEDLIKIFLEGSLLANAVIAKILAIGVADYHADTWLNRVENLTDEDKEKFDNYYDDCVELVNGAESLARDMREYLAMDIALNDPKDADKIKNLSEDELAVILNYGSVYEALNSYSYGGKTLAELLLAEELDYETVYPLYYALTDGQKAIAKISGFSFLVSSADYNKTHIEDSQKQEIEGLVDDVTAPISIYSGVDRDMYHGGVAITSDAKRRAASTGDNSWALYGNYDNDAEIAMLVIGGAALASTLVFIGLGFAYGFVITDYTFIGTTGATIIFERSIISQTIIESIDLTAKFGGFTVAGIGLLVSVAVLMVVAIVYLSLELTNYYDVEYTPVPKILMDLKFGEDDKIGDWEKYIKYSVVLDENGNSADLNCFHGKQWNALYVTKDKSAGNPILANSLVVNYGDAAKPSGCAAVHYFGGESAFDLNTHAWNNEVNGIYMFFKRDAKAFASTTGSVFTTPAASVITGISGVMVGAVGMFFIGRKKKQETPQNA